MKETLFILNDSDNFKILIHDRKGWFREQR